MFSPESDEVIDFEKWVTKELGSEYGIIIF
jgi:hypothetical protein